MFLLVGLKYLQLLKFHNYKSKIVTDKAPQNFRWIGFMKIFFPNCKIIHCNRDPKDNCLSIFKNNFPTSIATWSVFGLIIFMLVSIQLYAKIRRKNEESLKNG
mgnify:CR=1 FL=1